MDPEQELVQLRGYNDRKGMINTSMPSTMLSLTQEPAPHIAYYDTNAEQLSSTRPRPANLMNSPLSETPATPHALLSHSFQGLGPPPMSPTVSSKPSTPRSPLSPALAHREVIVVENGQVTQVLRAPVQSTPTVAPGSDSPKFGWIEGVLGRCLLNMLGSVLFLRLGWAVGNAGILWTVAILGLAALIAIITTMSLSAICTNGEGEAGAYHLISRAVGPFIGGIIGLLILAANGIAVAMYLVGLAEFIVDASNTNVIDGVGKWDTRVGAVLILVILLVISVIGVHREWTVRLQFLWLFFIAMGMLSVFIGTFYDSDLDLGFVGYNSDNFDENLKMNHDLGFYGFWRVFGIIFPCMTGFMAGVDMSSSLRDKHDAVPRGTLSAIFLSMFIYIIGAFLIGAVCIRGTFLNTQVGLIWDYLLVHRISFLLPVTSIAIIMATLTSAHLSLIRASRTLRSLAEDGVIPGMVFLAVGYGPNDEPVPAHVLTFLISTGIIIGVGNFNTLAQVATVVFLFLYAFVNYGCFAASNAGIPGWRPSYRLYSPLLALFGAVIAIACVYMSHWIYGLGALGLLLLFIVFVSLKSPDVNWGTPGQAGAYAQALGQVLKLQTAQDHVKNFRPAFLTMTGDPEERADLLAFTSFVSKGAGANVCGWVLPGPYDEMKQYYSQLKKKGNDYLTSQGIHAFLDVIMTQSFRDGARTMLQLSGLGRLRPNTLVMGFKADFFDSTPEDTAEYVDVIRDAIALDYGVTLLRRTTQPTPTQPAGYIDIWWYVDDGGLTLLLAHLLSLHAAFSACHLRVFSLAHDMESLAEAESRVADMLSKFRIDADAVSFHITVPTEHAIRAYTERYGDDPANVEPSLRYIRLSELIHQESMNSAWVFISLPLPHPDLNSDLYMTWLDFMTEGLPPSVIMRGNGENVLTFDL